KGVSDSSIVQSPDTKAGRVLRIPLNKKTIHAGGNKVTLTVLEGSWVVFDHIRLEGPMGATLINPGEVFVRAVEPADYELQENTERFQPLLVDVEHLSGKPVIAVELDGQNIYKKQLDTARYKLEIPMPAVK